MRVLFKVADPSLWRDVPNHRLICASCIEWVDFDDLYEDPAGQVWDVCKPCGDAHLVAPIFAMMAGWRSRG